MQHPEPLLRALLLHLDALEDLLRALVPPQTTGPHPRRRRRHAEPVGEPAVAHSESESPGTAPDQRVAVDGDDGPALAILFEGMARGSFTGKKLSDYFEGGSEDWVEARRIVNGADRAALAPEAARLAVKPSRVAPSRRRCWC